MERLIPSSLGCGSLGGRGLTGAALTLRSNRSLQVEIVVMSKVDCGVGMIAFGSSGWYRADAQDLAGVSNVLYAVV